MCPGPGESIYLWMYRQGLSRRPLDMVMLDIVANGHDVRDKDIRNYWNGWYNHDLYFHGGSGWDGKATPADIAMAPASNRPLRYSDYPEHPYKGMPEVAECFVPCNGDNRPMVKWGDGCMSLADARAWPGSMYVAENLKGGQRIVVDVDGDHGGGLDLETIEFFDRFRETTCCHVKPDIVFDWYMERGDHWCGELTEAMLPTSYHLTFGVDRVVPTMHFPRAHVDIVGNRRNSLRYFKNKIYNGLPPLMMDDSIWDEIMDYIEERERRTR